MPFTKGNKGRPKGAVGKVTAAMKTATLLAFDGIGGQAAFEKWARENPSLFYNIAARLIPSETNTNVTGEISVNTKVVHEHHRD